MKTGCKIWLWIMFISGIIGVGLYLLVIITDARAGIFGIAISAARLAGIGLLLFKQEKKGFVFLVTAPIVDIILSLVWGVPMATIIETVFGTVISLAITYSLVNKSADAFR